MAIQSTRSGVPTLMSRVQFGSAAKPSTAKPFPNGINPNTPALKQIDLAIQGERVLVGSVYPVPGWYVNEACQFSFNKSTHTVSFVLSGGNQVDVNLNSGEIISCSESLTIPQAKMLLEKVLKPAP